MEALMGSSLARKGLGAAEAAAVLRDGSLPGTAASALRACDAHSPTPAPLLPAAGDTVLKTDHQGVAVEHFVS